MRRAAAGVLTATGIAVLLGISALGVFFLQPFGERQWLSLALASIVASLILAFKRTRTKSVSTMPASDRSIYRFLRMAGMVLTVALGGWFVLVGWSALSSGGSMPEAEPRGSVVRVITWNILRGRETGAPWSRFGWPVRKRALETVLLATSPDILCVQEALDEQVNGLAKVLAGYGRVGVGRDDGASAGEHCAVFFNRERFNEIESGTFWLAEPTTEPPKHTLFGPKRICTWVRLEDRKMGGKVCVYNLHSYLTGEARLAAARIVLNRIAQADSADAVLVTGDFNAPPEAPDRLVFEQAGLESSGKIVDGDRHAATYQFYGIRLKSLDDVLVSRDWQVMSRRVLDMKPGNTFPSDHFGVMVDLDLKGR